MDQKKLLCKQDLCITDEPSSCIAKCPIHVDVRGMIDEVTQGNFKKAYKILVKKLPFPNILCRVCDHVCEDGCLRKEKGGCIDIQQLEKAVVKYGETTPSRTFPIPKNGKKVAVIGGGISGLTAAVDLDKKGYTVTIYEKENKLGGRMRGFPEEILPEHIIEKEMESVLKGDIQVKFNSELTEEKMYSLINEYDAVYIGIGRKVTGKVDEVTFELDDKGIFVGGMAANNNDSVILAVSSGRRAAVSIDRYVQKKSMTAARENEGAYTTSLKLNVSEIPSEKRIQPLSNDGFSEEEAIKEAKRCIKCQCIECHNVCSHIRKYNMMPKKYIRQINHNESIIMGDHYANEMINSCTMCGLCGEACPSNLNMVDIISDTRKSMVEKEKMPPSAHDFAIKDMEFSNSEKFTLLKHQLGFDKSKYLFFPGCQLSASSPQYIEKIYNDLTSSTNEGVGIMLGCCGAPAEWAGREELFKNTINTIKEKWRGMGKPTLVLACSSCCNTFKNYAPEISFISLWEFMVEHGIQKHNKVKEKKIVTIHDACSTRYNNRLQESVRKIITDLGYEVEELKYTKEKTKCCGYGGLVYYANKEQADEFIKERIQESDKDYIVYCAMCRDLFASQGKKTLHLLDLIYGENLDMLAQQKGPRFWERRINRSKVKSRFLELRGEEEINDKNSKLNIVLSNEIKDLMEDRWILLQDVEEVIKNAEASGEKFINPANKHYLARKELTNVTYWVEYEKKEDSYIVYNTYSHRMEVMEAQNEN